MTVEKVEICFGFNANFRLVEATGDMATVIAWRGYEGPACGLRPTRSELGDTHPRGCGEVE